MPLTWQKLCTVCSSCSAERQQMGQRGRALVTERFSEEYVINQYLSYSGSAINHYSGSAINHYSGSAINRAAR